MRWFLIDSYGDIAPHVALTAKKLISHNEEFYENHFPWNPVFPATLLLEMMAQAGGVLAGISLGFSKDVFLGKIERADFFREISPPAQIQIRANLVVEDSHSAWTEMELSDEKGVAATSKIMFVFLGATATAQQTESRVFTDTFLKTYNLLEFKNCETVPL